MDETTWKIDLAQTVESPLYGDVIDWLKVTSQGRNVVFDFWARGSYTRRLIHQRQSRIEPLTVLVSSADELRWAYRRLMLLGIPIDFITPANFILQKNWCGRVDIKAGGMVAGVTSALFGKLADITMQCLLVQLA